MLKRIAVGVWVVVLISLPIVAFARPIVFAPLPMVSGDEVKKQFYPFAKHLSDITGNQVDLAYYQNYKELLEAFIDDKIDLAYLGPLPYVLLIEEDPTFVPLVRFLDADGESTYTCSLVTFDVDILNRNCASPTLVALTQPYSTCGYLLTEELLNRHDLSLTNIPFYYTGQHSECVLDVVRGKATVAGVKTSIAKQYSHLGLHLVEQSEPLPGFLLVANSRTFTAETIEQLRSSLLQLEPYNGTKNTGNGAAWGKSFRNGTIPVEASDYQCIVDQVNNNKIPGVNQ